LVVDFDVHSIIVKQLTKHIAISSFQEFASTKTITKEKVRGSRKSTLTQKSFKLQSCDQKNESSKFKSLREATCSLDKRYTLPLEKP
jgi:hypothetical protein